MPPPDSRQSTETRLALLTGEVSRLKEDLANARAELKTDILELAQEAAGSTELKFLRQQFEEHRRFMSKLGWAIFAVVLTEFATIIGLIIQKAFA